MGSDEVKDRSATPDLEIVRVRTEAEDVEGTPRDGIEAEGMHYGWSWTPFHTIHGA
jgi:hypothetical protein